MENKEYYRRLFPLLTEHELIPNSESDKYNCISYTIGRINCVTFPFNENSLADYWQSLMNEL